MGRYRKSYVIIILSHTWLQVNPLGFGLNFIYPTFTSVKKKVFVSIITSTVRYRNSTLASLFVIPTGVYSLDIKY